MGENTPRCFDGGRLRKNALAKERLDDFKYLEIL